MVDISGIEDVVCYDPSDGSFTWKIDYYRHKAGGKCGHLKKGYLCLKWKDNYLAAHRAAFYFMNGKLPSGYVDHINGDTLDNRWENLREVSATVNAQNKCKLQSISGLTGVVLHRKTGRWQAQININGKQKYLGLFVDKYDAHSAYVKAKMEHHDKLAIRNIESAIQ